MSQPPSVPDAQQQDLESCQETLQRLLADPQACLQPGSSEETILRQASALLRRVKSLNRRETTERDRELRQSAPIRQRRRTDSAEPPAPAPSEASRQYAREKQCYVCRRRFSHQHHFYDLLCPACGDENFSKREATVDLTGRRALLTGGRVKIGFQIALKLLRAGAETMITTRFPVDAARRFSGQADFDAWSDRLRIFGTDFRWLAAVEELAGNVANQWESLDILINNAAQTIRRPPAFYRHLIDAEQAGAKQLAATAAALITSSTMPTHLRQVESIVPGTGEGLALSAAMSQLPTEDDPSDQSHFPAGQLDEHGQQIDLRPENSWVKTLAEVSNVELLEVHAVNCLAPFLLIRRLQPLMLASSFADRYIVNVSAMEGRFSGTKKTGTHPHTNMAKAALNMITRTCGDDFAGRGIYLNSVDTGWVTNEYPAPKTKHMQTHGFEPPLDEVDGAARVCDPIFAGVGSGQPTYGKFLKDYREIPW